MLRRAGLLMAGMFVVALAGCATEGRQPKGTIAPPDVAGPPADAQTTASGLSYRALSRGTGGRRPGATSRVVVNYTGWSTDGTVIDGAPVGSAPVTVDLSESDVMRGWREAVGLMAAGDKFRFWIPPHLAYQNQPGKPQGMLVYDIYLIDFAR